MCKQHIVHCRIYSSLVSPFCSGLGRWRRRSLQMAFLRVVDFLALIFKSRQACVIFWLNNVFGFTFVTATFYYFLLSGNQILQENHFFLTILCSTHHSEIVRPAYLKDFSVLFLIWSPSALTIYQGYLTCRPSNFPLKAQTCRRHSPLSNQSSIPV